ncbi:SMC-Scp complex subunit ScpB [Candidatus Kaiserbacteria bacterium]|nr:SMC-Scp complex subunit ScpB [Candidatus Kaiserbacteria bacterium]
MKLDLQIEGLLFYKASPIKIKALSKQLAVEESEVKVAAEALKERLGQGATRLIMTETDLELVTAPELDPLIETIRRDEMKRDIGKAGAETLAIILYKGPVTRSEIDRVRGVNSSFILRNLQIRGLVARVQSDRGNEYNITPNLLAHLGIESKNDLPEYSSVLDTLEKFEAEVAKEASE